MSLFKSMRRSLALKTRAVEQSHTQFQSESIVFNVAVNHRKIMNMNRFSYLFQAFPMLVFHLEKLPPHA